MLILKKFLIVLFSVAVLSAPAFASSDCDSFLTGLSLQPYHFIQKESDHPAVRTLWEIYNKREGSAHWLLDQEISKAHALNEMSFQTRNPKTGNYDQTVAVPVNSRVAVIQEKHWKSLVESTGPVLRALRELLQNIYSNKQHNKSNLKIESLPKEIQDTIIKIVDESIYLEPALIDPVMKNYPFLAVAGFDGAIGDPKNPEAKFFEVNLGTPSGLSNNYLLRKELENADPEVSRTLNQYQPKDDTFLALRKAIDDNAFAWTGIYGGLSVVVSPGIYNGAHPDVAEIAKLTGMPLVKPSDLYISPVDNVVRLNTGKDSEHPIVTGIYGRMEESYFLQSSRHEIPMISPNFVEINKSLNERLNLNLRPGAIYKYIYDANNKIIDVEKDKNNRPIIDDVYFKTGDFGPEFLRAIHTKKLYYSALGGRVVDDKRLFRIVSQYLAKQVPGKITAHPVAGLKPSEFNKLYENPDRYVVKEPSNSGGQGVYFLAQMSAEEKLELLAKVKAHPENYDVQDLNHPTTVMNYEKKSEDQYEIQSVPTDLRIFVTMDSKGEVYAGPNSALLRTAPKGSLFSNTSKGGGYGILAVVTEKPSTHSYGENKPPQIAPGTMSDSQFQNFVDVLSESFSLSEAVYNIKEKLNANPTAEQREVLSRDLTKLKLKAKNLSFQMREVLEHLPLRARTILTELREFSDKEQVTLDDLDKLNKDMVAFYFAVELSIASAGQRLQSAIEGFFDKYKIILDIKYDFGKYDPYLANLLKMTKLQIFSKREVTYKIDMTDSSLKKFDWARVDHFDDSEMQKMLTEIQEMGGEIRISLEESAFKNGKVYLASSDPGFWVNYTLPNLSSYLRPIINLNPFDPRAYSALAHEMVHFRDWRKLYQEFRAQGLSHEEAAKKAQIETDLDENLLHGERAALQAEIEAEKNYKNPFNRFRKHERASEPWQFGIVNRTSYPEFEALRRILLDIKSGKASSGDQVVASELMKTQIEAAQAARLLILTNPVMQKNAESVPGNFELWQKSKLIDLLCFPFGIERLEKDKTLKSFIALFKQVAESLHMQSEVEGSLTSLRLNETQNDQQSPNHDDQQQQQQ